MSARRNIDFFFCSASPWSYLAFIRLLETAVRSGASISFRPVIAATLQAPAVSADAAQAAYAAKDLRDWARFCGVRFAGNAPADVDETLAQCAILAANEMGQARQFCEALFRARHGDARDIGDRRLLLDLAASCGLVAAEFDRRLDAPGLAAQLAGNAAELQRRGGFTTPTMFAVGEMFVGHDRMPLLEMALMRASDRPFIAPGEHDRI